MGPGAIRRTTELAPRCVAFPLGTFAAVFDTVAGDTVEPYTAAPRELRMFSPHRRVMLGLIAGHAGCDAPAQDASTKDSVAPGAEVTISHMRRMHAVAGQLVSVDKRSRDVVIHHDAVTSLELSSGSTQFPVSDTANLSGFEPGTEVEVVLVRDNFGQYVIRELRPGIDSNSVD